MTENERCAKCTRCCCRCVVDCYDEVDNSVPVVDVHVANVVDSWFNDDDWVCVNSHVANAVDPFFNDDWDADDDVFVTVVDVSDDDNYDDVYDEDVDDFDDVGDVDEEDFVVEDGQALCLCEGRCPHKC